MTGRRAAYETLLSIIEDGAYANLALKNAADRVATSDVAALYATVYTATANAMRFPRSLPILLTV